MYIRNIACCLIIRTNHLSEAYLVLISSDNRRSTVYVSVFQNNYGHTQFFYLQWIYG